MIDEISLRYGLALLVLIVGVVFLYGLYRFGTMLFGEHQFKMFEELRDCLLNFGPEFRRYKMWVEGFSNWHQAYLEKRNDFWEHYGQVALAVLIVVILAVLLLTKTITAEAGLPILSAVAGFAIAKSNSSSTNMRRPESTNSNEGQ